MRFITAAFGAWLAASLAVSALGADEPRVTAFSGAALGEPPAAWKFATLPRKQPTKFSVVELGGAHVLKVEAEDSYGNLVHGMHAQLTERSVLSWRWRVDKLVEDADLRMRSGDDAAAKVCVFFAFDPARLSFGERTRLKLANSATGETVPAQTLCYVWDNKLPVDTAVVNAFSKRIRFIVLHSGSAKLGQWVAQRRNLAADYQRMFGDESEGQLPEVSGVAVSADSDNTHGHGLAYIGDIALTP